jgi:hypothetical protein
LLGKLLQGRDTVVTVEKRHNHRSRDFAAIGQIPLQSVVAEISSTQNKSDLSIALRTDVNHVQQPIQALAGNVVTAVEDEEANVLFEDAS